MRDVTFRGRSNFCMRAVDEHVQLCVAAAETAAVLVLQGVC